MENMKRDELKSKINIAIDIFYVRDEFLVKNNVHERTISAKFANYLQALFPHYDVDCEYDKYILENEKPAKKDLLGIKECNTNKATDEVIPDIIIHKRGPDGPNYVVFELKSKSDESKCDKKKLELFTKWGGHYNYHFGVFIKFSGTVDECKNSIKIYKNGTEI